MSSTQRKCWQKKRSHSFGLWWRPVQLHMPSVKLSIALKNCSLHVGLFGVSQIFANCFWMISQWVHSETISKHIDRSRQEFFRVLKIVISDICRYFLCRPFDQCLCCLLLVCPCWPALPYFIMNSYRLAQLCVVMIAFVVLSWSRQI